MILKTLLGYPLHSTLVRFEGEGGGGGGGGNETWHSKLPEDLRGDASLADFKDEAEMIPMPINVARSYINTKKLVGRDKIPMPKTDEEWNEAYTRLGRPATPDEYEVTFDGVEDTKTKEFLASQTEWIKKTGHALGLNKEQMKKFAAAYKDQNVAYATSIADKSKTLMQDSELKLRQAYGNNFEGKMILMNRAIDAIDQKYNGFKGILQGIGASKDPTFVQAMVLVGEMMAEDLGLDRATGNQKESAEDLDAKIAELRGHKAYLDARHPEHNAVVQKMADLMKRKHGVQPVDQLTRASFITP